MKQSNYIKAYILEGVSTLDAVKENLRIILLLLMIMSLSGAIYGGHSILDSVDPSFDPQIQTNSFDGKTVSAVVPLADGKILVAGRFNSYNRQPVGNIVRLNPDATIDTTFNSISLEGYALTKIIVQSNGKILVQGYIAFSSSQITETRQILRLNSDGTLDTTFNYTLGGSINDIAVDASERIIVAGGIPDGNVIKRGVIRLNSDGSQDATFQFNLPTSTSTASLVAAQGNKAVVCLSDSSRSIVRLNENGTIDAAFNVKTFDDFQMRSITVQPDGKILVLSTINLYRLNENGGDDNGFTTIHFQSFSLLRLALANDGKIVLSLSFPSYQIRRYHSNGTIDDSFTPYILLPDTYSCHGVQPDGSVIIGDSTPSNSNGIPNYFSRLSPNGTLDTTFNVGGIGFQLTKPGSIETIAVQEDGKILIGGRFETVGEIVRLKIARLNADSSLDTNFQISTSGTNFFTQINAVYDVNIQPDGKMLVSGWFDYFVNGVSKSNLVRLNANGDIDPTFSINIYTDPGYFFGTTGKNKTAVLDDGKIIVGTSGPTKLNADGSRDTSFNPMVYDAKTYLYIFDLVVQPDGKIIIGGYTFDTTSGARKSFLVRLNSNGSLDQTFDIGEDIDRKISALVLLPNGKILLAKTSIFSSPVKRSDLVRLNSDGSIDNAFNAGTGANDKINTILALPTGKIFVGGRFTEFNGQNRQNLVQLNADGSVDSTNYTLNNEVLSLAVDSDGRILVGGNFTIINAGGGNAKRSYVARLIDSTQSRRNTRFDFDGDGRADLSVYRPSSGFLYELRSRNNSFYEIRTGAPNDKFAFADYDGDGKTNIAIFREPIPGFSDKAYFYILNGSDNLFRSEQFGTTGDMPMSGDWDGDGISDIAVYRSAAVVGGQSYFFYRPSSIANSDFTAIAWGTAGDKPVLGDFDGDGKLDAAVFRPSNGFWYVLNSSNSQVIQKQFGVTTDIPTPADFDGDGKIDIAVFRNGFWYISESNGGFRALQFGNPTDLPVAADYDGDGKADVAVYRSGYWYILKSSNNGFYAELFGSPNDLPIPAVFH